MGCWFSEAAVQMFFKIGVLKNFATLTGTSTFAGLFLQNTYGVWIVSAANTFFSAESGIYSWQSHRLLLRIPLKMWTINLRSSHWNSLKKGVLRNFANFTGKHLCWNLKLEFKKFLRTPNLGQFGQMVECSFTN